MSNNGRDREKELMFPARFAKKANHNWQSSEGLLGVTDRNSDHDMTIPPLPNRATSKTDREAESRSESIFSLQLEGFRVEKMDSLDYRIKDEQ